MKTFQQFLTEVSIDGKTIDATKFEMDLVGALNGVTDVNAYQNAVSQKIANAAAHTLRATGVTGVAARNSGQGGKGNLTDVYKKYGVTSGESKTDIVVGTKRFSMKYGPAAQIAAAQANETQAVFAAAFEHDARYTTLIEQQILPMLSRVMDKSTFYSIRKKFDAKDLASFGNQLSRFLHLHSSADAMVPEEVDVFAEFLSEVGVAAPAKTAVTSFLASSSTKETLFYEFASGEKRFVNAINSPTHMLAWFDDGHIKYAPVRSFVKSHLHQFNYSIRDRGSKRGAALRIGIGESTLRRGAPLSLTMTPDQIDMWVESRARDIQTELLQEGLLSTVNDTITQAVDKVWTWLVEAIKKAIRLVIQFAQRGLLATMNMVGLQPTRIAAIVWDM